MSETPRSTPTEQQWPGSNGYQGTYAENARVNYEDTENTGSSEMGKALLVAVLGGLISAAGYLVYQRLPDEQKDRLQRQAKDMLQQRINEVRQNFNI
jgi:hypothetical protein